MHTEKRYNSERKHKMSFFRNLIKAFIVMLAFSALLLGIFAAYLSDYQSFVPDNLTEEVTDDFEALVSENSIDATKASSELISECTGLDDNLQKPDNFISYFTGMYDGSDVSCVDESMPGDSNLTYKIYAAAGSSEENMQLGELVLTPSDAKSFFHNTRYEISSLNISGLHTYKITAPSDVAVYADGKKLNAKALDDTSADGSNDSTTESGTSSETDSTADSETSSDTQSGHFLAAGLPDTEMSTYVIGGREDPTYIGSVSADGCSVKKTDDDTWNITYMVSDDDVKDISSFADRFVHSYSEFATRKNASSSGVKDMIYKGASLLDSISVYDNSWGQTYTSSEYTDDNVTDICKYADHEYSCRASCTYTIKNGTRSKDYDFAFILYITDLNGEWKVTDMKTVSQS